MRLDWIIALTLALEALLVQSPEEILTVGTERRLLEEASNKFVRPEIDPHCYRLSQNILALALLNACV